MTSQRPETTVAPKAERVGPRKKSIYNPGVAKTDPSRAQLRLAKADAARALKALSEVAGLVAEGWRWRQILAWMPEGAPWLRKRATAELEAVNVRLYDNFAIVQRALGYDPLAEPPAPPEHWDKGA